MSYIEIHAKDFVKAKTFTEKRKALAKLKKAIEDQDKYQEDYMIGYRQRNTLKEYKPHQNPYNSQEDKAKWDGWYQADNDIAALSNEQS